MRIVASIACIATLVGCGDPLVEGDYRGQPLFELSGTIRVEDSLSPADAEAVRVGLLWVGAAQQGDLTQGRSESSFPARYSMQVFTRPPDRAMRVLPDRSGLHGVARIVLYIDNDGDNQLDALERIVGAAPDQVLTYFTSSEATSLVRGDIRDGYQLMELFGCDDRLEDKSTFGPVERQDAADLTLASGIAQSLLDIVCDTVADDLCFDLRLQVQEDPSNTELVTLYQDRCDVQFEPEFNNSPDDPAPDGNTDPNGNPPPNDDPDASFCEREPDHPDCRDAPPQTAEQVISECSPLLSGAIGTGSLDQREAYWRFSVCTGAFDPCDDLGWDGGEELALQYQECTFVQLAQHREQWCRDIFERLETAEPNTDDRQFLEAEFERGGCADAI